MEKVLIVKTFVNKKVKENGMRVGGELLEGLSEKVEALLDSAIERAKSNKKKTVNKIDL